MVIDKFDGTEYGFLSNFYIAPVKYEGMMYMSNEAAFQAAKIKMNTNEVTDTFREPFTHMTPSKAKQAGRRCQLRPDWEIIKDQVMYEVVKDKFTRNPELRAKLLATGDAELIEGTTWHDNYWGNCSCEKCKNKHGRNQLGKTLMRVRSELTKV